MQFLNKLGCGDIGGFEIYGIVDNEFENSGIPDAIWLTLKVRKESKLDKNLVLISQSIEGYYALDVSKMNDNGECPVVDWIPTKNIDQLEVIASDFSTFFLESIEKALS